MRHASSLVPAVACIFAAMVAHAQTPVAARAGAAAFGGFETDAPGVRRLIRPGDLPAEPTIPGVGRSSIVPRPAEAAPEVPSGFHATLVAAGLKQPRVLRAAPNGDVFVAESGAGRVRVLRSDGSEPAVFASGLSKPYGIAFFPPGPNPRYVYVGEEGRVVRFAYHNGDTQAAGPPETIIPALPSGGNHWTRDLAVSGDGLRLFVSVGSASNVAQQIPSAPPGGVVSWDATHGQGAAWGDETGRADIFIFNPDGSNLHTFATGLRNCSGLAVQPDSKDLWCVVNERDGLGDNLPTDYATHVVQGGFYGWPWFYIGAHPDPRVHSTRPDLEAGVRLPDVLIQAHSAPLGIAFYEGAQFPLEYRGDAFVTLHGSWNRSDPTGYKVVRLIMRDGKPTGEYEDFMTGFVENDHGVWGRPVGVAVAADGSLLVGEDANGTIWRVSYASPR